MEILLNIDNYDKRMRLDNLNLSISEKESIKETVNFGHVNRIDIVNIGTGVDWIVILLVINIGFQLLKVGAELNDGIDGWIGVGKKLWKLFRRKKIVSIDVAGATALAIALIAQKEEIIKLEKIQESTVNLVDVSAANTNKKGLSKKPHNYYLQTYKINDENVYVVGIESTGAGKILKYFRISPFGIIDNK